MLLIAPFIFAISVKSTPFVVASKVKKSLSVSVAVAHVILLLCSKTLPVNESSSIAVLVQGLGESLIVAVQDFESFAVIVYGVLSVYSIVVFSPNV